MKHAKSAREIARAKAGSRGGKIRSRNLTAAERSESARLAVEARWEQERQQHLRAIAASMEPLRSPDLAVRVRIVVAMSTLLVEAIRKLIPAGPDREAATERMTTVLTAAVTTGEASAVDALQALAINAFAPPLPRIETIRVADMLAGLRSADLLVRVDAGQKLAFALGAGMRISGAGELDLEHGIGKDLAAILGRAMAGDSEAATELERRITNEPAKAANTPQEANSAPSRTPIEPPAEIRKLAKERSSTELIDAIARPGLGQAARKRLFGALMVRTGQDTRGRVAEADIEHLIGLAPRLITGDGEAVEEARRWVAKHVLTQREEAL